MCGIVGVVGRSSVGLELYEGLSMMQHRGQDAAESSPAQVTV